MGLTALDSVVVAPYGGRVDVGISVVNRGSSTMASSFVEVVSEVGLLVRVVVEGVRVGERREIRIRLELQRPGIHTLQAVVVFEGDEDPTNDSDTFVVQVPAPPGAVVIAEVMAAPAEPAPEWIEVVNRTAWELDLLGWRIRDRRGTEGEIVLRLLLRPGERAVLCEDEAAFQLAYAGSVQLSQPDRWPSLNNLEDSVTLVDVVGLAVDSVEYVDAGAGRSLERIREGEGGGGCR